MKLRLKNEEWTWCREYNNHCPLNTTPKLHWVGWLAGWLQTVTKTSPKLDLSDLLWDPELLDEGRKETVLPEWQTKKVLQPKCSIKRMASSQMSLRLNLFPTIRFFGSKITFEKSQIKFKIFFLFLQPAFGVNKPMRVL